MNALLNITWEDVQKVCNQRLGMNLSEESAQMLYNDLNHNAIEAVIEDGTDINEQTCNAYDEIEFQIKIKEAATKAWMDMGRSMSEALKRLFQSGG